MDAGDAALRRPDPGALPQVAQTDTFDLGNPQRGEAPEHVEPAQI